MNEKTASVASIAFDAGLPQAEEEVIAGSEGRQQPHNLSLLVNGKPSARDSQPMILESAKRQQKAESLIASLVNNIQIRTYVRLSGRRASSTSGSSPQ